MNQKVSKEQAREEIETWLDCKKIGASKRTANESHIEILVEAISEGDLILNEDKTFVHNLKFPSTDLNKLEYKPRLSVLEIHSKLEGVKSSDGDGRVLAFVAALTGKAKQIIRHLDSEDYNISQAIAIFFI